MAYVKQNFVDGNVLHASELNHIEDGIADAALDDLSNVTNATVAGKIGTGAITATKIAANAVSTLYTATVPANGWVEQSGAYINTVTVNGLLASDNPIIDWRMDGVSTYEVMQEQIEAWNSISVAIAYADNTLVVTAMDAPTVNIPVKILCIRK